MRRHKQPKPATAARAVTFECDCGTIHQSPDTNLPVGWSTAHGQSWCNDCTTAGIPARQLAAAPRKRRAA